jgi:RHS repeat-associated protein
MQHGPKEELRVAALCAEALPLAADLPLKKYASGSEHRASEKLASWVFGQKSLHCFRAAERLSGKLRWGCENSSGKTAVGSAVTIDGASYTVDNAGYRTAKTDQRTAVATSYGYDNIYQLLAATQGATTTESYAYDAVGNRTSSLGVASYTTNSSNEMTANSNASFTYDANGNTLTKGDSTGTRNYTWDFENRMTSVTLPGSGGTVSFKYDPFGRRVYKSSSSGTSIFAYDSDNMVEETNSSGSVVARYSQGLNIDEPLAMLRSSTTSFYNADGLGSVTSLSNAAGALVQTYTFDSLGNQTASSGSLVNPFQYTGREFDTETGLYYYRARYFDPVAGRFLNEDPIRFGGGINFFSYALQNPTNIVDPRGLQAATVVGTEAGCAVGGPVGCAVGAAGGAATDVAIDLGATAALGVALAAAVDNVKRICHQHRCDELQKQIREAMTVIQGRVADLLVDTQDLYIFAYSVPFPGKEGTYLGHIQQAGDWQRRLRNLLGEALSIGCPVPPEAWRVATQRLPNRPWPKKNP